MKRALGFQDCKPAKSARLATPSGSPGLSKRHLNPERLDSDTSSNYAVLRAVIPEKDVGAVIGKGGKSISGIRASTGCKLCCSDKSSTASDRVLTVSGPINSVAWAFNQIALAIASDPNHPAALTDKAPKQRIVSLRFLVPLTKLGLVIGKQGAKIKEIEHKSGANLRVCNEFLPKSTEKSIYVSGTGDSINLAAYWIASVLICNPEKDFGNILYNPTLITNEQMNSANNQVYPSPPVQRLGQENLSSGPHSEQLAIYSNIAGSLIGKGGSKINDIRSRSGCLVKLSDPDPTSQYRIITLTGTTDSVEMAKFLINEHFSKK